MKLTKHKKIFAAAALVVSAIVAVSLLRGPGIIDPNDPKFDPMTFRFENYSRGFFSFLNKEENRPICYKEFRGAVEKMFPMGTSKEYVEKILVHRGGAYAKESTETSNATIYSYDYIRSLTMTVTWIVKVTYNEKNEVVRIYSSCGLTSF